MGRQLRGMASIMLAVALIFTLIPVMPTSAAEQDGKYFQFLDLSTSESNPKMVYKNTIDINATFSGISEQTISYKVETFKGNKYELTSDGSQVRPNITGPGAFTFPGVKLGEGLNRITLSGISNSSGSNGLTGSSMAYVKYSNVPAVGEVTLLDGQGRKLIAGQQTIVTSSTVSLMIEASNANRLTVKGKSVSPLSEGMFLVSDLALQPGLNTLEFVASNDTMTYSITRDLVYYEGFSTNKGTPYDTKIGSISLDNKPTISPSSGTAIQDLVSGKVVFIKPTDGSTVAPVINIAYNGTDYETIITNTTETDNGLVIVSYRTKDNVSIEKLANPDQVITVEGTLYTGGPGVNAPIGFKFFDSNAPYITGVEQVFQYNSAGESAIPFADNSTIGELPIVLKVNVSNNVSGVTSNLQVKQSGNVIETIPGVGRGNSFIFEIKNLREGDLLFEYTVMVNSTETDKYTTSVRYTPSPFIELTNIYNGATFTGNNSDPADKRGSNPFVSIKGRLVNFSTSDYNTVKLNLNGKNVPVDASSGEFEIRNVDGVNLVTGPNKLVFQGKTSGIPVSTTITVYLFSEFVPIIKDVTPLPYESSTPNTEVFIPSKDGDDSYVTTANKMDLRFAVSNVSKINIYMDGTSNRIIYAELNTSTESFEIKESKNREGTSIPYTLDTIKTGNDYLLTLRTIDLVTAGVKSITIEGIDGATKASKTIQVTREFAEYELLSPKLPQESVIKQNFLQVSIQAEGADQILIGKEKMAKDATSDIFRLEIRDLKKGKNTIKFTIYRGEEKLNRQFEVNYTEEINIGSQYKAQISKSGKVSAFKSGLTISLPKGTLLQEPNPNPGQQAGKGEVHGINMFDSQDVLFGIADPTDGRTLKNYNTDGKIQTVDSDLQARAFFNSPIPHYGFVSKLYWIDGGYFIKGVNSSGEDTYETKSGTHPYGNPIFYNRGNTWLEPSQRGTITLQYDPNIVNAAASNIGVWYWNPLNQSDNKWVNLGGKLDSKKKTITSTFNGFGYYVVMGMRYSYDDVISHRNARNDIELVLSRGLMNAKDPAEFNAYESVTRGEFATMLVKIMDIPLDYPSRSEELTFQDVGRYYDYRWDYRYIETAVRKGIIRGTSPKVFLPGQPLKREDAAVMIARAMNLKMGTVEKDLPALQKAFTDTGKIASNYSVPAILAVTKAEVMTGIANETAQDSKKPTYRFDPQATFTRADAAVIAMKVAQKLKKL